MEKIPWPGVERGALDQEQSCVKLSWLMRLEGLCGWGVGGHKRVVGVPRLLIFFFCFLKMKQKPSGMFPNHGLTTTRGTESPFDEKRRGRESFGGHHCGNVVNCAFLRPWESHSRAGTCGHGKRGANGGHRPQRRGSTHAWSTVIDVAVTHFVHCWSTTQHSSEDKKAFWANWTFILVSRSNLSKPTSPPVPKLRINRAARRVQMTTIRLKVCVTSSD